MDEDICQCEVLGQDHAKTVRWSGRKFLFTPLLMFMVTMYDTCTPHRVSRIQKNRTQRLICFVFRDARQHLIVNHCSYDRASQTITMHWNVPLMNTKGYYSINLILPNKLLVWNPSPWFQTDDIMKTLRKHLQPGFTTNLDEFVATLAKDVTFKPYGRLIHSYVVSKGKVPTVVWSDVASASIELAYVGRNCTFCSENVGVGSTLYLPLLSLSLFLARPLFVLDCSVLCWLLWAEGHDRNFEIYKTDIEEPGFRAYHERVQPFLMFYIDGASFIDVDDDRWMYYLM